MVQSSVPQRTDLMVRLQPPSPAAGVERGCVGVLTLLHPLVLAAVSDWACFGVALHVAGPVDADGVVVTGVFNSALAGE